MGVERRATTIDISWFIDLERNGQLQMNPPYQRKSVWTHKDKLFFLDTSLLKHNDLLTDNKTFARKRTTHLYSVWSYIALEDEDNLLPEVEFSEKLKHFFDMYETVENTEMDGYADLLQQDDKYKVVIDYYKNSIGAATEEEQRTARLEALRTFMS